MSDQWTFLVSDPTITHAHLSENGGFYIDEVDYMNGVYQMVAEKVVLKKVVGKNCLAWWYFSSFNSIVFYCYSMDIGADIF